MRRLAFVMFGLGMFLAAEGCCHTAGVCDCEGAPPPCAPPATALPAGPHGGPAGAPAGGPEVIREMPKQIDK